MWRASMRAIVVAAVWWLSIGPVYIAIRLAGEEPPWPGEVVALYRILGIGLSLAPLVIVFTVMLFSWPRSFIPPHLRHQPGAVSEWISGRHRRSSRASRPTDRSIN